MGKLRNAIDDQIYPNHPKGDSGSSAILPKDGFGHKADINIDEKSGEQLHDTDDKN
ncbi:hypothetical protein WJ0W_001420 [Paenibacillus melissococcoides]|uniref:DUF4025 domain-containing protein n=1 Tax=Paenibacillus melissococcoides TaxID=2912268 RepID=A0ABM9FY73_9BACL|nr:MULTISPECIES: hypothetical protein [Paenibacillus]MEB9893672.1 hypothetical protein [Bacillus cereus]CAH8244182.1 hypothetical protein WJ0W_001420 [Paenibacillus melissococcoides]CAH8703705.1 hypothetical protein HTL2_000243 [Paenibacillus melissococcoides]CAH8706212.1 hypothetical protein WDD9_001205 [Paenibacillus melissococcoides]GIO77761.1 hypothetical protein J6TS7_13710 [Paenibacillus dendritiformis]